MPITFQSIDDPYGIRHAGTVLGQALIQRNMEKLQNQRQIEREDRSKQASIDQSGLLGKALEDSFLNGQDINLDDRSILNFYNKALQSGVSVDDINSMVKILQDRGKTKPTPQTPFGKESAKANVRFLGNVREKGMRADEMLGQWDKLDSAIEDPSRTDNPYIRTLKGIPGAQYFWGEGDQTISQNAKELITNFTDLKGIRLSDAKLKWLESIAPAPWKSREANMESSRFFKRMAQLQSAYYKISNGLAQQYEEAGLDLPSNFQQLVDEAVAPLQKEIDDAYNNRKKEAAPSAAFNLNQTVDQMPPAQGNEGMEITDDKGKVYRSNGKRWTKVK